MPVITLIVGVANGEVCVPTGQLGIAFNLAVHVTCECSPITDDNRITPNPLVHHYDNDSPSDDGSHFLSDVE